ncbi:MAG: hypothetical protein NTX52_13385 [Planctomycetota bacterium]|nr:hypothetical protein [Planctomycetota bacterium]
MKVDIPKAYKPLLAERCSNTYAERNVYYQCAESLHRLNAKQSQQ